MIALLIFYLDRSALSFKQAVTKGVEVDHSSVPTLAGADMNM